MPCGVNHYHRLALVIEVTKLAWRNQAISVFMKIGVDKVVVFLSQFMGLRTKLSNQLNLRRHAVNVLQHLVKGLLVICLHVEKLKLLQ